MGSLHADIASASARQDDILPMTVSAVVDNGALHLRLPQHVGLQMRLPALDRRIVSLADGAPQEIDHVGPVKFGFADRQRLVGTPVPGDEALPGAGPMEDMDLVISPAWQALTVNPTNPDIAVSVAKGFRTSHP